MYNTYLVSINSVVQNGFLYKILTRSNFTVLTCSPKFAKLTNDQARIHSADQAQIYSADQAQIYSADQAQIYSADQARIYSADPGPIFRRCQRHRR